MNLPLAWPELQSVGAYTAKTNKHLCPSRPLPSCTESLKRTAHKWPLTRIHCNSVHSICMLRTMPTPTWSQPLETKSPDKRRVKQEGEVVCGPQNVIMEVGSCVCVLETQYTTILKVSGVPPRESCCPIWLDVRTLKLAMWSKSLNKLFHPPSSMLPIKKFIRRKLVMTAFVVHKSEERKFEGTL